MRGVVRVGGQLEQLRRAESTSGGEYWRAARYAAMGTYVREIAAGRGRVEAFHRRGSGPRLADVGKGEGGAAGG